MLNDPLLKWTSGRCPYDVLSDGKITSQSSMKEVIDVPFQLIEQGSWNSEEKLAWEEIRTVPKRLLVDFLLLQMSTEEIMAALRNGWEKQEEEFLKADFEQIVERDLGDLQALVNELKQSGIAL
jgi:hypothetical protein